MLCGCCASHLDQSFASHSLEQLEQIALALFRIDVILLHHGIAKLPNTLWLLQKVPHGRAHRVHPVVDAVLHIQDGRFVPKGAEYLILGRDYDRMDGNCGIHLELEPSCRVDPPAERSLSFLRDVGIRPTPEAIHHKPRAFYRDWHRTAITPIHATAELDSLRQLRL